MVLCISGIEQIALVAVAQGLWSLSWSCLYLSSWCRLPLAGTAQTHLFDPLDEAHRCMSSFCTQLLVLLCCIKCQQSPLYAGTVLSSQQLFWLYTLPFLLRCILSLLWACGLDVDRPLCRTSFERILHALACTHPCVLPFLFLNLLLISGLCGSCLEFQSLVYVLLLFSC